MNSAFFAAFAGNAPLPSELAETDIIKSALEASSHTDGLYNPQISNDVRELVRKHDRGVIQDFEIKDISYKAILGLAKHLGSILGQSHRNGLIPELLAQSIKFVKSVPAEQIYLRFEITDKKPNIPDFNPAHMCAYDADRSYGTEYLQIARRLTIYGSTSSVMANRDLGAFLESGKKKCAVLYLGTHKDEDIEFLALSHSMALDLIVTGLEGHDDIDELMAKADVILFHPEVAKLQQEAASLHVMLTEFRNKLDPDTGREIAQRLLELRTSIDNITATEIPVEYIAHITGLVDEMIADTMIQEVITLYDLDTDAAPPHSSELEYLQSAIDAIIFEPTLSTDEQAQKILTLLQARAPSLLEEGHVSSEHLKVFLDNLTTQLKDRDISLPVLLLDTPRAWGLEHSEKLADFLLLISNPEHADPIKEALKDTQSGAEVLEALDRISENTDIKNIDRLELIKTIHEALTTPSDDSARFASDLLHLMTFTHNADLISLVPSPIQSAAHTFVNDTLPAQHGLVTEGIVERINLLADDKTPKFEFSPPYTLPSVNNAAPIILPFLVQPAAQTVLLTETPEHIKGSSDPTLRDSIVSCQQAIQTPDTIRHLQNNGIEQPRSERPLAPPMVEAKALQPIGIDVAIAQTPPPDLIRVFSLQNLPDIAPSQRVIEHYLDVLSKPNPPAHDQLTDIIVRHASEQPHVLDHLSPQNKAVVAAIVARSSLEILADKIPIPHLLRQEIRQALHSTNTNKLVEVVPKVIGAIPLYKQPPELMVLNRVMHHLHAAPPSQPLQIDRGKSSSIAPAPEPQKPSHTPDVLPRPTMPLPGKPISPKLPVNDNPIVDTPSSLLPPVKSTGDSPRLKQEFEKACRITGELGCSCSIKSRQVNDPELKTVIESLKVGEETKLGNGTTIKAEDTRINNDGSPETLYSWKDGGKVVFKGTPEEIQQQIKKNADTVKETTEKYKDKFEKEPTTPIDAVPITPPHKQMAVTFIKTNEERGQLPTSKSNNVSFDESDFEPDFGDDELLKIPTHQLSGYSPK